jgi:hypothetical protein
MADEVEGCQVVTVQTMVEGSDRMLRMSGWVPIPGVL